MHGSAVCIVYNILINETVTFINMTQASWSSGMIPAL
jgi:hypothetical protein